MIGPIRSLLFAPGTRPDRFVTAMNAGADAVAFDLEDSVEAGQKARARALVAEFLATPGTGALRLIRFNPPQTPDGEADLECFAGAQGFDGVLLPKIETASAVERVARTFARRALSGAVPPLLLLLETPRAILKAAEIATADAPVSALLFGAEDYTASLSIERTIDGEELSFARAQIVLAAALVGADAIDAVCIDLNNSDALRRDSVRARALGFRGKMAIHPRQLDVINESFTPTLVEVERARKLIGAYEAARASGQGVTTMDGQMVELPIVERARRLLAVAARLVGVMALAVVLTVGTAHAGQVNHPTYEGPPPPLPPEVMVRDAEGRTTIRAVRVDAPLRIDGSFDEALYESVPAMSDFVQIEPDLGAPATEKTEVWIAFDGDNVYLSFRCWDTHPERRVATEMRRDGNNLYNGNDVISIFLDTFYDRRNGIGITMNSIGGRNDGQVVNGQYNADWNPVWDMANGSFDGGWTLEMALPFKSLRYRTGTAQIWGFNVLRTVRWRNELSVLIPVPPLRGMNSIRQPQLAATIVGIDAPPASNNLEVKPYAVSSVTTDASGGPPVATSADGDVGLDVKYSPTQNLVADFTYNTDFAQVEADEQQVNLTRFSLFFPEKREFFLENRDTFAFGGVGAGGRGGGSGGDTPILFYSRRIGLDAGQQVPIVAGGRLTGRVGRFTVGLMDIQTASSDTTGTRSTNFSTVRLKRDILARSSVGLLATGRSVGAGGGAANAAIGIDANFNFLTYLTVDSYWAKTRSDGVRSGDDTSYRAAADYAGDRYGVQLEHLAVGAHFQPELGYVRRQDIRRSFGEARFSPRLASNTIRKLSWTGSIAYVENGAGRLEGREEVADFGIEFQNADLFNLTYTRAYEFVPRAFQIASDVAVPVGGYDTDTVTVRYTLGPQRAASVGVTAEYGTFYSGHRTAVSATRGRLNFGPRLSLEPTYSVNFVDLRQGSFSTHLGGSRVTYTMTPQMFVSALVQFNSASQALSANVRLRWEYQPGSELFVVYNDERDTRGRGVPELTNRALVVKFNHLFRF